MAWDYREILKSLSCFALLLIVSFYNSGCGPKPDGSLVVSKEQFIDDSFWTLYQGNIEIVDIPVEKASKKTVAVSLVHRKTLYYDEQTRKKILSVDRPSVEEHLIYSKNENQTLQIRQAYDSKKKERKIIIEDFQGLYPPRFVYSLFRHSGYPPLLAMDMDSNGDPEFFFGPQPYDGIPDSVKCVDHTGKLKWSVGTSDKKYPSLRRIAGYVAKDNKNNSFLATYYDGKRKPLIQIIDRNGKVQKTIYLKNEIEDIKVVELDGQPYFWVTSPSYFLIIVDAAMYKYSLLDIDGNVKWTVNAPRRQRVKKVQTFYPLGPNKPYICVLRHFDRTYKYSKFHIYQPDGTLVHTETLCGGKQPIAVYDIPGTSRQGILAGNHRQVWLYTFEKKISQSP